MVRILINGMDIIKKFEAVEFYVEFYSLISYNICK